MTFYRRAENYPPCLVRLLARSGNKPLTTVQISEQSGLTPFKVEAISHSLTWKEIDIESMRAFTRACGMDFCSWRSNNKTDAYIRSKPSFEHLRKSPSWSVYYMPLLLKWAASNEGKVLWNPMRNLVNRMAPVIKK